VVIYLCRAAFSQERKEQVITKKRVFAPATPSPTTDEGPTIDSISLITPPPPALVFLWKLRYGVTVAYDQMA
jgi:hypothetical protein